MAGTRQGAFKAALTNKQIRGNDYFRKLGRKAGSFGTTGGFASELVGEDGLTGVERSKIQGARAGRRSGHMRRIKRELDKELERIDNLVRSGE